MVTVDELKNGISNNIGKIAIGAGVGVVGAGLVGLAVAGSKHKKKTAKGRSRDRKFISNQKHERRYKRKTKGKRYKKRKGSKSKKRTGKIYYAKKTGQPYILKANGQAKFIKGKRRKK